MGEVSYVSWDDGCNLCLANDVYSCLPDNTNVSCTKGWFDTTVVPCQNCYMPWDGTYCAATSCAPKVYVAWQGTDKYGQSLLSSGTVLSRFSSYSLAGVTAEVESELNELVDDVSS